MPSVAVVTSLHASFGTLASPGPTTLPLIILSSFLKRPGSPNIPIQAIGLSLYEELPPKHDADGKVNVEKDVEQPGTKVTRTQWLDLSSLEMANLIGKNILIVDEVDDTRTTLEYAVKELMKDVELARQTAGKTGDEGKTRFSIFVLHVSDAPWNRLPLCTPRPATSRR